MDVTLVALRLVMAGVLFVAAVAKLRDLTTAVEGAQNLGIPPRLARLIGPALPAVELTTATLLLPGSTATAGAVAALLLFASFTALVANAVRKDDRPSCNCFGQLHSRPVSGTTVARNAALTTAAAAVLAGGVGPGAWAGAVEAVADVGPSEAVVLLALVVAAQSVWIALLSSQVKAARDVADHAAAHGEPVPVGRPIGSRAPRFRLRDLAGRKVRLDDLLDQGKPVVLVFTDPGCGPCEVLYSEAGDWQRTEAERVTVVVVSSGDLDANRRKAEEHRLELVLVQKRPRLARTYGYRGTPSAVLITPDGKIGSQVVGGGTAVRAVVVQAIQESGRPRGAAPVPPPPAHYPADPAPPFELTGPVGTGLQVFDLYGHLSVLLLWDRDVAGIEEVEDELQRVQEATGLAVAVITPAGSRQAPPFETLGVGEDDGLTARALGLTEVPSAVLLDTQLRFASEPATGPTAVVALLRRAGELAELARSVRPTTSV